MGISDTTLLLHLLLLLPLPAPAPPPAPAPARAPTPAPAPSPAPAPAPGTLHYAGAPPPPPAPRLCPPPLPHQYGGQVEPASPGGGGRDPDRMTQPITLTCWNRLVSELFLHANSKMFFCSRTVKNHNANILTHMPIFTSHFLGLKIGHNFSRSGLLRLSLMALSELHLRLRCWPGPWGRGAARW